MKTEHIRIAYILASKEPFGRTNDIAYGWKDWKEFVNHFSIELAKQCCTFDKAKFEEMCSWDYWQDKGKYS